MTKKHFTVIEHIREFAVLHISAFICYMAYIDIINPVGQLDAILGHILMGVLVGAVFGSQLTFVAGEIG